MAQDPKAFIDMCITVQSTSQDPAERAQAEQNLESAFENPQSILILLDLIEKPLDPKSPQRAACMLKRAIQRSHDRRSLGDAEINSIVTKLLELALASEPPLLSTLAMTLHEVMEMFNYGNIDDVFDKIILPAWETRSLQAITILNNIAGELTTEKIAECAGVLVEMIRQAIQVPNWDARSEAINVLFIVAVISQGKMDCSPLFEHIVRLTQEIVASGCTEDTLGKFWSALVDPIEAGFFPDVCLVPMFQSAIAVATNGDYDCYLRYKPLSAMIKVVPKLDPPTFSNVMDLTIAIAMEYTENENDEVLPEDFLEPIVIGFDRLPPDAVYGLMKEKMNQLLSMGSIPALTVVLSIVTIVLRCAPETVYKDTEWLMDLLVKGFQSGNPLLMQAVCQALEAFEDTLTSITKYAPAFIMMMVPVLVCPHVDLRHCAYDAFESLLKVLDTEVEGLFPALWGIKDGVDPEDLYNFIPFLAEAIEKSTAIGDQEIATLLEFISPHYNIENPNFDIERAVCLLNIAGALITNVDALGDQVARIVEPIIEIVLRTPTVYDLYIVREVLHYIETVYNIYGPGADKYYGARVQFLAKMALEDDTIDVLQGLDEAVVCDAFTCCCTIAKATRNSALAKEIEERCQINLDWDEELVEESLEYTKNLIKLLPIESTIPLFRTFSDFVVEEANPALVHRAVKIIEKCLSASGPEHRAPFLQGCCAIVNGFITGTLACLNGVRPTEGKCDHYVMCGMLSLISKICKFAPRGPIVDDLCRFAISMMAPDNAALFSIVGVLSEAIRSETCSPEMLQLILAKIHEIMPSADDPAVKQNVAWSIKVIIERHPESTGDFTAMIPLFYTWINEALENPAGNQESLANIASLMLQYAANGAPVEEQMVVASIQQLPSHDEKETVPMVLNMMSLLQKGAVSQEIMKNCIFAVCDLLLLNDGDKIKHDLTPELLAQLSQWLASMRAVEGVEGIIAERYANANSSIVKLNQYMPA